MICPNCQVEGYTNYCVDCGEHVFQTWKITYCSCEGNIRWYTKEVPADWQEWQVRETVQIGGCGDDPAEILQVELV